MTRAYWAWPSVDILCGECCWAMYPFKTKYEGKPVRRLVYCVNHVCKYAFKVREVKVAHALELTQSEFPDVKVTRM